MRNFTTAAFIFILFCTACKKNSVDSNNSLIGKWKTAGSMLSNGGPMYYAPPANKDSYVQFNANNTLSGDIFQDYSSFTVKDSVTVTFTRADKTTIQNYRYSFRHDTLTMSPAGPIYCIEGCAVLLVR